MQFKIEEKFRNPDTSSTLFNVYIKRGWFPYWEYNCQVFSYEDALNVCKAHADNYKKIQNQRQNVDLRTIILDADHM